MGVLSRSDRTTATLKHRVSSWPSTELTSGSVHTLGSVERLASTDLFGQVRVESCLGGSTGYPRIPLRFEVVAYDDCTYRKIFLMRSSNTVIH